MTRPYRHFTERRYADPPRDYAVQILSHEEMVARIEAVRLEAADPCCPTCGSRAEVTTQRICTDCRVSKPLTEFVRNRSKSMGRDFTCRVCKRPRSKAERTARTIRRLQRHLWEAAS